MALMNESGGRAEEGEYVPPSEELCRADVCVCVCGYLGMLELCACVCLCFMCFFIRY